jgi:F-type H+-transporting ATPase subunit a
MRGIGISVGSKFIAFLTFLLFSFSVTSSRASSSGHEEEFNAGEMILHHVQDAHEIHIAGDFSIYLPIILVDNGVQFFSSSHFYHNQKEAFVHGKKEPYYEHDGYILYHEKVYKGSSLSLDEHGHPTNEAVTDLSITKSVAGLLLVLGLMTWMFISVAKAYSRHGADSAPRGLQSFMEPLILFIRNEVAKPSIGKRHESFMPYLLTVFFFILFCNILGLIPFIGGFNITGNIAVTLSLALLTFIITTVRANKGYWMHIVSPPGVPAWLLPIMLPIEIIGVISKPIVLTLRLFANITAGHIIILSFVSLIFIFNQKYGAGGAYGASVLSLAFSVFMNFLELLVAFLQAYVFTLLSALYFGSAIEEHHHEEAHH